MTEHPADRQVRVLALFSQKPVVFDWRSEDGFWSRPPGQGKRWDWTKNPVTSLNTCELCGRTSTPRRVHIRNDVWMWHAECPKDPSPSIDMLCTGCWNKARAVVKRANAARECRTLLNKLTRSIRDERRKRNAG